MIINLFSDGWLVRKPVLW